MLFILSTQQTSEVDILCRIYRVDICSRYIVLYLPCEQSALEGQVRAAVVTWRGQGAWTPATVCFDWDNTAYEVRQMDKYV